jgi:hypothetical protein
VNRQGAKIVAAEARTELDSHNDRLQNTCGTDGENGAATKKRPVRLRGVI